MLDLNNFASILANITNGVSAMHFRDRGNSIQLVRTTYDSQTKKPATEVVGRLERPGLKIDAELQTKLTADEFDEVTSYSRRAARRELAVIEYTVTQFPTTLKAITSWLATASEDEVESFMDEVQPLLAKMRRSMPNTGRRVPQPAPTAS